MSFLEVLPSGQSHLIFEWLAKRVYASNHCKLFNSYIAFSLSFCINLEQLL